MVSAERTSCVYTFKIISIIDSVCVCGKTVPLPNGSSISSIVCMVMNKKYQRSRTETCTGATFKYCRRYSGTDTAFSSENLRFPLSLLFYNHQFISIWRYMFLETDVPFSNIHTNINPTWTALGTKPSLLGKKSDTKSLSYGRIGGLLHKHPVTKCCKYSWHPCSTSQL